MLSNKYPQQIPLLHGFNQWEKEERGRWNVLNFLTDMLNGSNFLITFLVQDTSEYDQELVGMIKRVHNLMQLTVDLMVVKQIFYNGKHYHIMLVTLVIFNISSSYIEIINIKE